MQFEDDSASFKKHADYTLKIILNKSVSKDPKQVTINVFVCGSVSRKVASTCSIKLKLN